MTGSSKEGDTWDVLHNNTSWLSALVLLEEPQPQPYHILAVLPQQLQCKPSLDRACTCNILDLSWSLQTQVPCPLTLSSENAGGPANAQKPYIVHPGKQGLRLLTLYTTALTIQVIRQCTHRCCDLFSTLDIVSCNGRACKSEVAPGGISKNSHDYCCIEAYLQA